MVLLKDGGPNFSAICHRVAPVKRFSESTTFTNWIEYDDFHRIYCCFLEDFVFPIQLGISIHPKCYSQIIIFSEGLTVYLNHQAVMVGSQGQAEASRMSSNFVWSIWHQSSSSWIAPWRSKFSSRWGHPGNQVGHSVSQEKMGEVSIKKMEDLTVYDYWLPLMN